MKFNHLSVKRLFGRMAMGLVLSMSGITIALFLVTKQMAVLLTGGALLLCALVGIFVLTLIFGKRLSQFTAELCQTLDHMIAGNEAPHRPEDSETQLARIGHRLARLYQIMQENRRRVDEERQELQALVSDISHQVKTPVLHLCGENPYPAFQAEAACNHRKTGVTSATPVSPEIDLLPYEPPPNSRGPFSEICFKRSKH